MTKNLLPHIWKKIALGIFLVTMIIWIINMVSPELLGFDTFIVSWIFKMSILASLLLYVLAKEKVETPRNPKLRFDSLFAAVTAGGFLIIMEFFMEILFKGENAEITSGYEIMMMVLVIYALSFYIKRNIKTVTR